MFAMFTMFRSASLILVLFSCASLPGQEVQTQAELAKKPPYERMLKGADLAKAQELQKKYQVSMDARKFAEAKKFAEELLALRTRIQGADHWLVTDARSKLADVEIYGKLKPEALAELAYARELYQSSSGFYQKGQFAASAELYEQVVTIRKKNLNENHPAYATSLNNLALVYHSMGEYAKAETLYLQTRDLEKKLRGENHPAYATSLNNRAALYRSMGENAKAEPLYLKARDLRKNLRG
ncbi:tetratricopeptide repeat protein, partial [bacterium]|nr:tetratricopeptide repeat protein [bacterium]